MTKPIPLHPNPNTEFNLQEARIDLAAAFRWAVRLGVSEGVDNHFSMAVPDDDLSLIPI